jgi:hypothetical protein
MNSQIRTLQGKVMGVTISQEPAFHQPRMARYRCRSGWLAVVLLSGTVGCAGLEQNHLTRRATVVQDRAIATSQPLDNGGFEIVVRVRPITEPTVPAGTTNPSIDVIASARSLVLPTSFQEPNAAPRANRNATPDRELRPIQPGQLTPTATRSPSDQLTELTEPGRLVINAESEQTTEFPIDLPTALRLAGANNLHIALAAERVEEALAKAQASRAKWLP